LDLNEWQWPECLALFAVGVVGAREGWIGGVPDQLGRQARALALWSVGLTAAFLASTPLLSVDGDELLGGWTWPALVLALLGAMLTVFGSVWLLSLAQRHLDREFPHGRELARSSYAAFILGAFVDLGVAVAMRPIPATGEIKALVVGVVAVVCSFALAWLIVVRLRLFPRVL
jgi:hypothetical protein